MPEQDETHFIFAPLERPLARHSEHSQPAQGQCGRFLLPISYERRVLGRLNTLSKSLNQSGRLTYEFGTSVPAHWQQLLQYLHTQGVIQEPRFFYHTFETSRPKFLSAGLHYAFSAQKTDGHSEDTGGFASSFHSTEEMLSKTIGETLERYFLGLYKNELLRKSSYAELLRKNRAINLMSLSRYLPWQQERASRLRFDENAPMYWAECVELVSGKKLWIPAQMIFWNYDVRHDKGEPIVREANTNGTAGHFTRTEAIVAGLLELIQRDGFFIYWLNSLSPTIVDVANTDDPDIIKILEYLKRYKLEAYFLDIATDFKIPSILCVIIDREINSVSAAVGAGTSFDPKAAILQSIGEALSVYCFLDAKKPYRLPYQYKPFTQPVTRDERLQAWHGNEMLGRIEFLIKGKKISFAQWQTRFPVIEKPELQLQQLLAEFRLKGEEYEVYVYEAKDKALDAIGYHAVKVIVPTLFPLYLNEHMATLDSKRLTEVPEKLGYTISGELNPWPHPFP